VRKKELVTKIYESLGKIVDLMLIAPPKEMLIVYLFSADISKYYGEYVQQLINSLNGDQLKIKTIIEFVNDQDLIAQFFLEKLSSKILKGIQNEE